MNQFPEPAANHTVDWTARYKLIAAAVALHAERPEHEEYIEDARLDALHRIELGIADSLQRGGTHPDAAAYLAFAFVDRSVAIATCAQRA
jgi:phage gp37-like protein